MRWSALLGVAAACILLGVTGCDSSMKPEVSKDLAISAARAVASDDETAFASLMRLPVRAVPNLEGLRLEALGTTEVVQVTSVSADAPTLAQKSPPAYAVGVSMTYVSSEGTQTGDMVVFMSRGRVQMTSP